MLNLFAFAVLIGLLLTFPAVVYLNLSPLVGFFIGFLCASVGLALLVGWKVVRMRVSLAWLRNEDRDLGLARRCADDPGRVTRRDSLTIWDGGPKHLPSLILEQVDKVKRRFEGLLDESITLDLPLRILAFADRDAFLQYCRAARLPQPLGLDGFYVPGTPAKCIAAMPNPLKRIAQPDRLTRTLSAFYFLHGYKKFPMRSWLYLGLGALLARDPTPDEQARLNRKVLPAAQGLIPALSADDLYRWQPRMAFGMKQRDYAQKDYTDFARPLFQAQSLLDFLSGPTAPKDRQASFREFLKNLQRRGSYEALFVQHIGYGLKQLYNNWRDWVLAKGMGEHTPPPPGVRVTLLDHVIPLVSDEYALREDRIQAIRDMGNAGYTLGADTLMDVLGDRDREVHDAAVWALEAISGTAGGEDIRHWESWWDALPSDVEPVTQVPPDPRVFRTDS
jgi:hypothetical protein